MLPCLPEFIPWRFIFWCLEGDFPAAILLFEGIALVSSCFDDMTIFLPVQKADSSLAVLHQLDIGRVYLDRNRPIGYWRTEMTIGFIRKRIHFRTDCVGDVTDLMKTAVF